jgi:threonine dehydrogenase-like Zn-dependent dehydrogenase
MPSELLLTGPRSVTLAAYDERPLGHDEIRAQGIVSGISHGTELALYRGASPFGGKRFDLDLRLFVEDETQHGYPMRLGYEWVGSVAEIGEDVDELAVGDRIHLTLPHRETHVLAVDAASTTALPPSLDPERATFLRTTAIALQAIHDARIQVGARVAVFGLGTFGLLAVQLARLVGAAWIAAVDPLSSRRKLGAGFGADLVLDPTTCDAGREIKLASDGPGVDVAVEFSGRYSGLQDALRSVRLAGTVVTAGFYVGAAGPELRLGEEWHHNRLTLVSSMSGWGAPTREPGWDRRRLSETALDLLASGRLQVDELVMHRIPFADAAAAYELIDRHPEDALRVVLTYR